MPISDNYVVQYLLESSRNRARGLAWQERDSGYATRLHELDVQLENVPNTAGARLCLTISSPPERVYIFEPRRTGVFSMKFENDEQENLARLLHELWQAAAQQCIARQNRSPEMNERLRQILFRRLIGAANPETESTELERTI